MKENQDLQTPCAPSKKGISPTKRIIKLFLIAVFACAIGMIGFVGYYYISSPTIRDSVNTAITGSDKPSKAFANKDHINLLLMGRDFDRDNKGQIVKTNGRTDSMMLAHIDFKNRTIDVVSIPRDTLVRIPGYRYKTRISYANAYGGPTLAMDTIEDFLGVKPEYYLLINFNGFADAIDKMGGLKIDVDKELDYDDNWGNLHIHLKPGPQMLNGEQAMGFVRYRKSNDGGGDSDLVRIGRQQQFMAALKSKLSSPEVAIKIPSIMGSIREDMETNLTMPQIICIARSARSLPSTNIRMHTLPITDESSIYIHADKEAAEKLIAQIFGDGC